MHNEGIARWVERRRSRSRDDVALVFRDRQTTYGDLALRVTRLRNALAARGVVAGDRVAYLGNNHPSFLETLFAVVGLGAVCVPLNTRLAPPEIAFMLQDADAKTLVFREDLAGLAHDGSIASPVVRRIVVDGVGGPDIEEYEKVLATGADDGEAVAVALDDPAIMLYTSGTTGRPKGAVLTHGNLTWNCFNAIIDYEVAARERVLLISPMFHVASLSMGALPVILQGGTVIIHEKFDPAHVLRTIESEGVSMLAGVPTTFQMLQEHPDWAATDISSLQHLTCGGSTMPERMLEAYEERGLHFSCGYGMTETAPGATSMPPSMSKVKMGSSGLPHFFTDVKVVDPDGATVAPGVVGEVWVRGPNVITEYWHRPDATAAAFADDWFRSGDLGYFDEDGYLYIADRLKDMIISGGENIYSAEVENVIMELPEIAGVAVIGVPDEKWGEVPLAVVVLADGATLTDAVLVHHLDGRLAKFKIPKHIEVVAELPRTASGKVLKSELRTRFVAAPQPTGVHS